MQSKTLFKKITSVLPKVGAFGLLACAAATAHAGDDYKKEIIPPPPEPRFYFTLGGGGEFDIHSSKFVSNGNGFFFNPFFAPDPAFIGPVPYLVKVTSASFSYSHAPAVAARAELGYHVNPAFSVFVGFTYDHANGYFFHCGQVRPPWTANPFVLRKICPVPIVYDLNCNMGDYNGYAGRAGFKLDIPPAYLAFINIPPVIKPYFTFSAGGKYVQNTNARFYASTIPVGARVRLYDDSWVFTTDGQLGCEYLLSPTSSVGLESGIGYDTRLSRPHDATPVPFITGVNRGGSRLYIPVTLYGKLRF